MKIETYVTGPIQVNTYVLKDETSKEAVIIDVGGDFEKIKNETEKDGYIIKYILCTHGHFDHVLGIAESEECDIPVYVNEKDKIHYENLLNTLTTWGFPSKKCDFRPTHFIDENTALSIGEYSIKIFETPGHSKGSVSYYVDGNLFCGDALFCESIGRTDFIDGDYDELITSIKSKLLTLPTDTKVYPGHGPSTTIQNEKLNNLFLV